MSERWQRLLADFEAAAAMSEEERQRFLATRRAEDPASAAELERLLAADTGSGVLDTDPQRLLDELGLPPAPPAGADAPPSGDLPPTVSGVVPGASAPGVPAVIGRYQVLERIGRGGFGDVYRGFDPVLKRAVAIKTCLADEPAVRQRFVREAELAARLVHPNIVTVHDFGAEGEVPYLVQELLPGEDLAHRLARSAGGKRADPKRSDAAAELSLAQKLRFLLDVAAGLAHAHAAGIVHRDVKPGNLRLLPDGRVKILDFGIARELGVGSVLTGDDKAIGTLAYMAPEQARGELPDARADVHGWGAVAYELLSGRRAVPGDSPAAMIFRLLDSGPPPLREVAPETPAELAALVDRCLEREAAKRPRDGGELLALLEPIARRLVPSGELAAADGTWLAPATSRRRGRRRLVGWAAALAAVVAMVVAARLAIRSADESGILTVPVRAADPAARGEAKPSDARGEAIVPTTSPPVLGSAPATATTQALPVPSAASGGAPGPGSVAGVVAGPPPAAAPLPTGVLAIDALPWGQLVRLVAADGRELPLPDDAITPLTVVVSEGDYSASMRNPQGGERSCQAHVAAGGRALCRVELRELRAAELLEGLTP
ncbi:MAG TPA: serine/threonine-protein kinase [Thermoanaerobaculia bacterium]|nr:serine/threonine-protein kinase [Thermoanaerobaculia bacterium]